MAGSHEVRGSIPLSSTKNYHFNYWSPELSFSPFEIAMVKMNFLLTQENGSSTKHNVFNGAVAQLGERMAGSHEVRGSIPLSSTKNVLCRYF